MITSHRPLDRPVRLVRTAKLMSFPRKIFSIGRFEIAHLLFEMVHSMLISLDYQNNSYN